MRGWRRDRNVPKLLLAYYLVNDGIVTTAFFTALTFRKSYGMEVQEILVLALLLQLVAIPATVFSGWLGGRWSPGSFGTHTRPSLRRLSLISVSLDW